jgi:PKD repeat protein
MSTTVAFPAVSRRYVAILAAFMTLVAIAAAAFAPAAHAGPTLPVTKIPVSKFFPRASLVATPAAVLPNQAVTFSATGSSGGLYGIKEYAWDFDGNGTYDYAATTYSSTTRSYPNVGTYTMRLRITNTNNQTATTTASVVVHNAPKAAFSYTPRPVIAGFPVKLDATDSSDDNGPLGTYGWDLDGNGTYETFTGSPNTTKTFANPGIYSVGLKVTDKYGATDTIVKQIEVLSDTTAPMVTITPGSVKLIGRTVSLQVACPATELRCTGPLSLRVASAKLAKAAKFTPGQIAVLGGDTTTVSIKVSKAAAKLIKRLKKVTTIATATVQDAAGNTGTTTKTVIVKR